MYLTQQQQKAEGERTPAVSVDIVYGGDHGQGKF